MLLLIRSGFKAVLGKLESRFEIILSALQHHPSPSSLVEALAELRASVHRTEVQITLVCPLEVRVSRGGGASDATAEVRSDRSWFT